MSMLDLSKYETFDNHLFTTQLKPIMEKTPIGEIAGILLDRWSNDPRRLRFFFQPDTKPEDATRVVLQWAEDNGLELVKHSHSGCYTDLFGFTKGIDNNRDRWYAEVVIIVRGERTMEEARVITLRDVLSLLDGTESFSIHECSFGDGCWYENKYDETIPECWLNATVERIYFEGGDLTFDIWEDQI